MMSYDFRWIAWNISKVEGPGLTVADVEYVVNHALRPYPKPIGNEKWIVIGATPSRLVIQVIYLADPDDTIFVIHSRPLTPKERSRRRRRQ